MCVANEDDLVWVYAVFIENQVLIQYIQTFWSAWKTTMPGKSKRTTSAVDDNVLIEAA